jgi:Mn2+/Fe2+ NRAMP family transporter
LLPYQRLAPVLKWLTLALFAYVAVVLTVHIPWRELFIATIVPPVELTREYLMVLVAVLGTTISPYLFFWQASQEVEEQRMAKGERPLRVSPRKGPAHLRRIKLDTWLGMTFSNAIAFCIMLTAAVTLHTAGVHSIETSAQAAEALRPIAGPFAFSLFAAGIIGTGLLAIPVLAGSAGYAVAEAMRWPIGHARSPSGAKGFYSIITLATLMGSGFTLMHIDPIKALLLSATINGVVAVPIMVMMMRMAVQSKIMGPFVIRPWLRRLGWLATGAMALAVGAMLVSFAI